MSESITVKLSRAFDLIEADQRDEAREILEPLLKTQRDNPDVWWLYAHAVDDVAPAEVALTQVQRLDPAYPGVGQLIEAIEQKKRNSQSTDTEIDDLDVESFLSEDPQIEKQDVADDEVRTDTSRQTLILLAIPVIIVLLLVLVFGVINPFGGDNEQTSDEEPTASSQVDTTPAPTIPIVVSTPVLETPEATTESVVTSSAVEDALRAASLTLLENDASSSEETTLGRTLIVSICSQPGSALRDDIANGMFAIAEVGSDQDYDAIGLRFVDCESDDTTINVLGVRVDILDNYITGVITQSEFRAQWTPIG